MFSHINESGKTKTPLLAFILLASILAFAGIYGFLPKAKAFPTGTAVLDSFNRADTGSISGSSTSHGETWANQSINDSGTSTLNIESNRLSRGTGNRNNAYLNTSYGPNTDVFAEVPVLPGNNDYIALWSRLQSPGSNSFNCYAIVYTHSTSGNASWTFLRFTGGSSTNLGTISAPAISAGDSIGFDVTGTGATVTLTAYQKTGATWSNLGSVNDTSASRITSGGFIGIEIGDQNSRVDNFGGGTIVSNSTPGSPTLTSPVSNATGTSTTPQFQLRSSDADGDDLKYKIEVCADAACSTVIRTIDQTSSQTGWSGQDKQSGAAYTGAASLASSTMAAYDYQAPALDYSTEYWWRAYAIDPSGTNSFSPASAISSFTTEAAPSNGNGGNSGSGNSGNGNGSSNNSGNNNSASQSNSGNTAKLDSDLTPSSYSTWGK